jgi:histone H3/H4
MEDEKKTLVIASRVKDINKAAGFSTSQEYIDALSAEVERLVLKGQACAEKSGRKTLKAQDL